MACMIQVRVDDDLKLKSDALFKELGTDTTSAIRMFLAKAVAYKGFPFEIRQEVDVPYAPMSEEQILEKLAKSRNQIEYGDCLESADMVAEVRSKLQDYESKIK